ncbi:MAG: response regulator transcription factor [Cyclobacteriaceae bacterium]|nr:response regulator transcription factor [Cyclobacteriaceae bacterium]
MRISILLVDDHPLVGDGIKTMLAGENSMEVIGVCKSGAETLEFIRKKSPDVVLQDINLPDENGLVLCGQIKQHDERIKIIGLTSANEAGIVTDFLARGGSGYLLKNVDRKELIEAIRTVYGGKVYLSREASDKVMEQIHGNNSMQPVIILTRREKQILELLAEGMKGPKIAEHLHLSTLTVETHRKNLFRKLNVSNVQLLLRIAHEKRLI